MKKIKRIVVKIGTKVLVSANRSPDLENMRSLVSQVAAIQKKGIDVVIVTSGAIGAGLWLLGIKRRPQDLATLQAAAAVGQNYLMHSYSEFFKAHGLNAGQMLLTQEDFNDRKRYLNIKNTIDELLNHTAVPIINENDTVATEEIKCGDNDRLSSLVADLCHADMLVLLTDVDGLIDANGNTIAFVGEITSGIAKLGGKSSGDLGTGGMASKLDAARAATRAGIECVIANGTKKNMLLQLLIEGNTEGTVFKCGGEKPLAKKRWIAFSSRPKGSIRIDAGAVTALEEQNKSLLASGILGVEGNFDSGDTVRITDKTGKEFARGLSNYSSGELARIKGRRTKDFKEALGYPGRDEVIHKDNLVIL